MSFNEIDDTLVAYFKQMLEEEMPQDHAQSSIEEAQDTASAAAPCVSAVDDGHDYLNHDHDVAVETEIKVEESAPIIADSTEQETADDTLDLQSKTDTDTIETAENEAIDSAFTLEPQTQTETEVEEETQEPLPFAEHQSLQSLLADLETKTQTKVETKTKTEVETKTKTEVAEKTETATSVAVSASITKEKDIKTDTQEDVSSVPENPYEWKNIEMPNEFQALFFLVKGIRFAVPLINLGGIFQCEKITPLFGKPNWFMGIADIRGKKMNVVDTLRWVKADAPKSDIYDYMIVLDKTLWSVGCDVLEGNRILSKEQVTWRETAGNRPWLAGIVKKEMCALLHVEALIKMFENGVNLKDLDSEMCE